MNKKMCTVVGLCAVAVLMISAVPGVAQSDEKEKAPMYSYVANWALARGQWADMEKQMVSSQKDMEKAVGDGSLVAYGSDTSLVHRSDGYTHDNWWSSMSMAGLLGVLDQQYKSGSATVPVLASATKHEDQIYVSRHYNWHPGTYQNVYTRVAYYQLKPDAPSDAVKQLSNNVFVPMLEKLLADGAIHEYEIDTEAIHTSDPGSFAVVIIAANGAGLDKFNAAVQDLSKSSPLAGSAIGSMVDVSKHRDFLAHTNARFK